MDVDILNSVPVPMSNPQHSTDTEVPPNKIPRHEVRYENKDEPFRLTNTQYDNKQYAAIYFARLMQLRIRASQSATKKWPDVPVRGVLQVEDGEDAIVVGCLYKEQRLKPSVLAEYSNPRDVAATSGTACLASDDDTAVVEDECGRVKLAGDVRVGEIVTGMIMALRGKREGDAFMVADTCHVGLAPQVPRGITRVTSYVAFVSGLGVDSGTGYSAQLAMLTDWITGMAGNKQDHEHAAKVCRVVIAGCLFSSMDTATQAAPGTKQQEYVQEQSRTMDMLLCELASCVPLDLMPGKTDPATNIMPQQPIHRCLVGSACAYASLNRCTNPHACSVGTCTMLGTSGQNIDDMRRYCQVSSTLDLLETSLLCGHVAPTAPDTLGAYPYVTDDPFVIQETPHVYFAGNQQEYGYRHITGDDGQQCVLLSIPQFQSTGQVVLLDTTTLMPSTLSFSATW